MDVTGFECSKQFFADLASIKEQDALNIVLSEIRRRFL